MKFVILLLALISIAYAASTNAFNDKSWAAWKTKYNKKYNTPLEEQRRYWNFLESQKRASMAQTKNPRAKFGLTKFSDLTTSEFANFYLMPNFTASKYVAPPKKTFSAISRPNLKGCTPDPTNYDWFAQCSGVCTPVYNQEQCGSCWAFSATETIESYFAIGGGALTQLSVQQIVDCDTGGQDQGCNGGFPSGAYSYVQGANGLDTWANYPYTAEDGTCQDNAAQAVATVTGSSTISGETGLYQQTSTSGGGPVSVCVDASSWQDYSGGVLTSCGNSVDHCVQLTGYAQYGGSGAYWIVRNSWGSDWGQSGFIWVAIGQDLCSIGDYATVVTAGAGN